MFEPTTTFGEISKLVASAWDALAVKEKEGYKRKAELAKKEYQLEMAAYKRKIALEVKMFSYII